MEIPAVTPFPIHGQRLDNVPSPDMKKDIAGVVHEFFTTQMKNIAKMFQYGGFWVSFGLGQESQVGNVAGKFGMFAGNTKDFLGAMEIPLKAVEVRKAAEKFYKECSVSNARELFLDKFASLVNSVCDAFKLSHEFVPFTAEGLKAVKGVNFGATLIGAANGAVKDVQKIGELPEPTAENKEKNAEKTSLYLINLAGHISYVALGIIGLASVFTTAAIAPWMIIACLTSGLTFTIGGFFYERLVVNPKAEFGGKHDDLVKVQGNLGRVLQQRNEAIVQRNTAIAERDAARAQIPVVA